jgi:signal peptidase I
MAVAIVIVVRLLIVQAFYIPSGSMLPQLQLQDKVVVSRLAFHVHPPRRGDIVVFYAPKNAEPERVAPHGGSVLRRAARYVGEKLGLAPSTDVFIKRVVGLPGDTVEGHDGHVYINGALLLEPYILAGVQTPTFPRQRIRAGQLWVMGDNRQNSEDSHIFGPIRESSLIGRAFLRVWPLDHAAFL